MAEPNAVHSAKFSNSADYDPAHFDDLASAIVEQRAIVYVGAGASVPSGGLLWHQLLEYLHKNGERALPDKDRENRGYLEKLRRDKKYLEAADLLQDVLGHNLSNLLRQTVANVSTPSSIHADIARIPFTGFITTNYDKLLESAFITKRPDVLTWKNAPRVLEVVRNKIRYLLKIHGDIDSPDTLVLSSRQYRDMRYSAPLYWQALKWIFMTNTCLFVGCSLTDPDLLHLFEEVIMEAGSNFGPHYALLPKNEAPSRRVKNLETQWNIKVITLEGPDGDDKSWIEEEVSKALVFLGGEVAKRTVQTRPPALPTSDDRDFYLVKALKKLLLTARDVTGSFRGDICLQQHDAIGSRSSGRLYGKVYTEHTDNNLATLPTNENQQAVDRRSVCGIAYYESLPGQGVIYDVESKKISGVEHRGEIKYLPGHTEVQSELALPILADGVRVGVINLESCLKKAYDSGHVTAANWYAEKAGRLFATALERNRRGRGLHPEVIKSTREGFLKVLEKLWRMRRRAANDQDASDSAGGNSPAVGAHGKTLLACLIFQADYIDGTLKGWITQDDDAKFGFDEEHCLSSRVFRERSGAVCFDAKEGMEKGYVSKKYQEKLELSGPLIVFPIHVQGYAAGVLFCWFRKGDKDALGWRDMELFRRASHLVANASSRAFMLRPLWCLQPPRKTHRTAVDQPSADANDLSEHAERVTLVKQHIQGVEEVVELCVGGDPLADELEPPSSSNQALHEVWGDVARRVISLIELLWIRYGSPEQHWMVPNRARLWVVGNWANGEGPGTEDPLFGLVVEVLLEKELLIKACKAFLKDARRPREKDWKRLAENWRECAARHNLKPRTRNLMRERETKTLKFVIARPERRLGKEKTASQNEIKKYNVSLNDFSPTDINESVPAVEVEDPDMSFLLSRQYVDGFARLQWPVKRDPFCGLLERQDNEPIYAAPIRMVLDQSQKQKLLEVENDLEHPQFRKIVGLLALDEDPSKQANGDGRKGDHNPAVSKPTNQERNSILQNELLHTVDLFTACLSERAEFRKIATRENRSSDTARTHHGRA